MISLVILFGEVVPDFDTVQKIEHVLGVNLAVTHIPLLLRAFDSTLKSIVNVIFYL